MNPHDLDKLSEYERQQLKGPYSESAANKFLRAMRSRQLRRRRVMEALYYDATRRNQ